MQDFLLADVIAVIRKSEEQLHRDPLCLSAGRFYITGNKGFILFFPKLKSFLP